jgi:flagella basal body P-ring formation protein FlgA
MRSTRSGGAAGNSRQPGDRPDCSGNRDGKKTTMSFLNALTRWTQGTVTAVVLGLGATEAMATAPADLGARLRVFVEQQPLPFDGEVEIVVGEPDPRLNLAACTHYEPFIPAGTRLWGRASLGMRCVAGANWTAYVPVQVKVFGPALVAARPIARGQALSVEDFRLERVEWTQWAPGVLAVAADQADGRVATRGIQPGEALRRDMLRTLPLFQAGEPIKVVYAGPGFSVNTEGKALTLGHEGQAAQAALGGGRVVTGVARSGKVLEVR